MFQATACHIQDAMLIKIVPVKNNLAVYALNMLFLSLLDLEEVTAICVDQMGVSGGLLPNVDRRTLFVRDDRMVGRNGTAPHVGINSIFSPTPLRD